MLRESKPNENPNQKPPEIVMPLPSGEMLDVTKMIEDTQSNERLRVGDLQIGDLVAFSYDNDGTPAGFTFEVTEKRPYQDHPNRSLYSRLRYGKEETKYMTIGVLQGHDLPVEVQDTPLSQVGSGFGGSISSPALLVKGKMPYFYAMEGGFDYHAPIATGIQVLRRDENEEFQVVPGIVTRDQEATT